MSLGPPLGISVLDLPPRLPLPAKIEIEVRPPVDLHERFGPSPSIDRAFEAITAEMQGTLDDLAEDRAIPVVG